MIKLIEKSKHLTATEKKAIKAILDAKLCSGRIGRKNYFITSESEIYTVKITENEKNDYGKSVVKTYTAKFTI